MLKLSVIASATLVVLGLSSAADAGGRPDLVAKDLLRGKQYAAGQIVVQYHSYATTADKQRIKTTKTTHSTQHHAAGGFGQFRKIKTKRPKQSFSNCCDSNR